MRRAGCSAAGNAPERSPASPSSRPLKSSLWHFDHLRRKILLRTNLRGSGGLVVGPNIFLVLSPRPHVIMFGGMCRYDDASGLLWSNIRFEADGSAFEITFDKRKNCQFRQGNKVLVASSPLIAICPVRLLRELKTYTGGSEGLPVFRGFNGRLVAKSPRDTVPGPKKITYDQFLRFMSLWFSGVMGVSVASFRKQFATLSGRSGGASAASNAGIPAELWGQHGDWGS